MNNTNKNNPNNMATGHCYSAVPKPGNAADD